jgi:hypothetical protein
MALAPAGATTYRLWIHTACDDPPGKKGDVDVCLHGALGSVWLEQLQDCQPSAGRLFGDGGSGGVPSAPNGRCEMYVAATEVGTIQRLSVSYARVTHACKPWKVRPCRLVPDLPCIAALIYACSVPCASQLKQIVVRHADGTVTAFPASCELRGPNALVELLPELSWHEDAFGNVTEGAPALPPTGEWRWPTPLPEPPAADGDGDGDDDHDRDPLQRSRLHVYRALLEEELLPLVDAALQELTLQRTPGSFQWQVLQAAAGRSAVASSDAGSVRALQLDNVELRAQLQQMDRSDELAAREEAERAKVALRRVQAEKAELEAAARAQRLQLVEARSAQRPGARQSSVCVLS